MCRFYICRFIVGCSARHRPNAAHPAATTQREETHPGRRQGRQVLRAPETQQPGGEKIARRPKIAGRRDRDPSELPREGKRHFTSAGCDIERGGKLFATVTAAKTFTTLMGSRGQGHSILVFLHIHIFSLPFLFRFCYFWSILRVLLWKTLLMNVSDFLKRKAWYFIKKTTLILKVMNTI